MVTSRQRYDDAQANLDASETIGKVTVRRIFATRFGRARLLGRAIDYLSFYLSVFITLCRLLRRDDIVVAKTDPPLVGLVCALAARLRGARLVNWLQDVFPEIAIGLGMSGVPRFMTALLARWRDRSCRWAVANVVLSERMREFFIRRGLPAERLTIIANWADGQVIQPLDPLASQLRASLGWREKFVVAYCGNLGRAHDYQTLVAAAELLRSDESYRFLMVGGGAGMVSLKAEVAARGLDAFRFLDYQPEAALSDTLAAADVHLVCLNPVLEGLIVPSKLYGVLAAGRPTVFWGDTTGDVAMEIQRVDAGIAVRNGDAAALVAALRSLQGDVALRRSMSLNARRAFEEGYTLHHAANRWVELLGRVQAPGAAGR